LVSAFTLIEVAAHLPFPHHGSVQWISQDLDELLPLALGVVLFFVAQGGRNERLKAMPYLGMLGAVLGRMSADNKAGEILSAYFALMASDGFI
jgi:hypothetical protein